MESKYVINVAKAKRDPVGNLRQVFFFRVEERDSPTAYNIFAELKEAFPSYQITMTYWSCAGTEVKA